MVGRSRGSSRGSHVGTREVTWFRLIEPASRPALAPERNGGSQRASNVELVGGGPRSNPTDTSLALSSPCSRKELERTEHALLRFFCCCCTFHLDPIRLELPQTMSARLFSTRMALRRGVATAARTARKTPTSPRLALAGAVAIAVPVSDRWRGAHRLGDARRVALL
jgi:hypothetical protein